MNAALGPGTALWILVLLFNPYIIAWCSIGVSILQVRKLRTRAVLQLVQGLTACRYAGRIKIQATMSSSKVEAQTITVRVVLYVWRRSLCAPQMLLTKGLWELNPTALQTTCPEAGMHQHRKCCLFLCANTYWMICPERCLLFHPSWGSSLWAGSCLVTSTWRTANHLWPERACHIAVSIL